MFSVRWPANASRPRVRSLAEPLYLVQKKPHQLALKCRKPAGRERLQIALLLCRKTVARRERENPQTLAIEELVQVAQRFFALALRRQVQFVDDNEHRFSGR